VNPIDHLRDFRKVLSDSDNLFGPSKAAALGSVSWAKGSGVVDMPLLPDGPM